MSQLIRPVMISTPVIRMNKRSADHFMMERKTSKKAYYSNSVLSWSSSTYHPSAASAVATVAAATAMNVNYSNFIPRV